VHHGDKDGDGLIEVSEACPSMLKELVPKRAAGSKVRAAIANPGDEDFHRQSAQFGSTGEDFTRVK
jgi:hypothetical protein